MVGEAALVLGSSARDFLHTRTLNSLEMQRRSAQLRVINRLSHAPALLGRILEMCLQGNMHHPDRR